MPDSQDTFTILSIDGGPAAPVQVRMLRKVEERYPGFLASTDMFAGTSDGAMVGMFLASRLPKDYETAKRISLDLLDDAIEFSDATVRALEPSLGGMAWFATGTRPLIQLTRLERILDDAFGNMMVSDIERSALVTSFDCGTWQPANIIKIDDRYQLNCNGTIREAILGSSALPMYTPVYRGADRHQHLDGVFVANNPSLYAATCFVDLLVRPENYSLDTAPQSHDKAMTMLRVLSLGLTESNTVDPRPVETRPTLLQQWLNLPPGKPTLGPLQWGWCNWIVQRPGILPSMFHQAQNSMTAWESEALFDTSCYFRYAPLGPTVSVVWDIARGHAGKFLRDADKLAKKEWAGRDTRQDQSKPLLGKLPVQEMLDWIRTQWLAKPVPNASPQPFFDPSQPPAPPDSPLASSPSTPKARRSRSARNSQ